MKNSNVVELGACWSITKGGNIQIWNSPWIPSSPSFKPKPNVNLVELPTFFVADLFLPGSKVWNVDLLHDLFYPSTVQKILQIHVPFTNLGDNWSWMPSSSGNFSVKSAKEVSFIPSSQLSPLTVAAWQALSSLKLQARLKHPLSKIAWDILPSKANIGRFVFYEDGNAWVCPFCKGPLETLPYIFLDCVLAKALWSSCPWSFNLARFSSRPISDWILAIIFPYAKLDIPKVECRQFQLHATLVLDYIWQARNKLMHKASLPNLV